MATATTNTNTSTSNNSKTDSKAVNTEAPFTDKATLAAHDAVDALSTRAASAEQNIREGASSSAETLSEKQKVAREKLTQYSSRTRQLASENPLATAGVAFAAGMLVSALIGRK